MSEIETRIAKNGYIISARTKTGELRYFSAVERTHSGWSEDPLDGKIFKKANDCVRTMSFLSDLLHDKENVGKSARRAELEELKTIDFSTMKIFKRDIHITELTPNDLQKALTESATQKLTEHERNAFIKTIKEEMENEFKHDD